MESTGIESTSTQALYDEWSKSYDQIENQTRDLEKRACESALADVDFRSVIELGGGTGKNTPWLAERAQFVLSVDLSTEMQAVAKAKVTRANVDFCLADIREEWTFVGDQVDLITCSLILEHIKELGPVFKRAAASIKPSGRLYVCELHPFKQYIGSKARFEIDGKTKVLDCYRHHISDYTDAAADAGFTVVRLDEWFDDNGREQIPRLISFLFKLS
jgi:ubiquinone/menaquinone biosynthesis C-methylase UbiE